MSIPALALTVAAAAFAQCLAAQEIRPRAPSAREIVNQLQPGEISARGISVQGGRSQPVAPPSINLDVNFEYGSAKLSPDAKIVLDSLGQALGDPTLVSARIGIAGHTDAVGTDTYNLDLSKRRAQAVADYLVAQHNIAPSRFAVDGWGKQRLLDTANPKSALNRRVQVLNLGQ